MAFDLAQVPATYLAYILALYLWCDILSCTYSEFLHSVWHIF